MDYKKKIKNLLRYISKFGCFLNLPILSFFVLTLFTKKIINRNAKNFKNILILPKSGGREDIYASYNEEQNSSIIYELPRAEIKNLYNFFVKSQKVTNYSYFHDDPTIIREKENYFNFLKKIIFYFKKFYKINLIINFNFTYKEEVELARASIDQNVKFVSLQKESQASDGKRLVNEKIYNKSIKKYNGSCIIVYNEDEKRNIVNSGIIDESKVFVVGCPRIDYSFNIKKKIKDIKKKINLVYYCIQTGVSLPIYEGIFRTEGVHNIEKFDWSKLARLTEVTLSDFATKNSSKVNTIFKTKTGMEDQVQRIKKLDLSNIDVIYSNTGHHLLEIADVVVAFNSTIIFEAIAAGVPVIVPTLNLGDIQEKFVFNLNDVDNVFCSHNLDEFQKNLKLIIDNPTKFHIKNKDTQKAALKKFVGNQDGRSGKRFRELIKEINV